MLKKILFTILFLICFLPIADAFAQEGNVIIIKRSTNDLAYYENGKIVKTFKIAANRSIAQSPVGIYKIVLKKEKPTYLPERIPGGHPNNPLGSYWLGFNYGDTQGKVYGIHGTNKPSIIGSYTDKGNFSMRNEDIRWLYNRVSEGTPVIITNSTQSFQTIYNTILGKTRPNQPSNNHIYLVIDGILQTPPQNPIIKDDRTFLPFRYVFEKIGAKVEWIESEKRVIATKDRNKLQLVIGSNMIRFNGTNIKIDTAPFIVNGSTYVPLRSVFEYFDYNVEWDEENRIVFITKKEKDSITFYINDEVQPSTIVNQIETIYDETNNEKINELLVPAKYLLEKFGAQATFLPYEKKLLITRNEQNAELIADSKQMKVNGYRNLLETAPTIKNGEMLIPLEVVVKLFGATIHIENDLGENETIIDLNFDLNTFSKIYFNGNTQLPYTGFIVDNVHYFPFSLIFIELNGKDHFDTSTNEIEMIRDGMLIQMHIDSHSAFVNGKFVNIPHPPKVMDGQVILPLQFITDTLGLKVTITNRIVHIYE